MERLTDKKEADSQRREYENRLRNGYPRNIPEERFLRLAAYEDTGLEPEAVSEFQRLCASYVEAGLDAKFVQACIDATKGGVTVEQIRELAKPNTPLTLEELREMDGEPVWVEFPKCPEASGWMLVDTNRHCVYCGLLGDCDYENCGKTWLAYRRKPEEGI